MIKDLVTQTVSDKVSISQSSEATFTDKYLMPSIRRVLLSNTGDDVIYAMWVYTRIYLLFICILNDCVIIINRIDKLDINNKKPDFMLGAKNNNKEFFFFFVEVKRPKIKSKYQDEEDFTKLLKQLKTSIDKQLYLGIENPASLGLLVEGMF
jgi:hypothetical protein